MYTVTTVSFPADDAEYEVGSDVSHDPGDRYQGDSYEVDEPDVSAPDCALKLSRLVDTSTLPAGWSVIVEEALIEAYCQRCSDAADARADYEYDRMREEDDR